MSAVHDTATPIFDRLVAEAGLSWPVVDEGEPPSGPDATVDGDKEFRGTPQHFGEAPG